MVVFSFRQCHILERADGSKHGQQVPENFVLA